MLNIYCVSEVIRYPWASENPDLEILSGKSIRLVGSALSPCH